MDDFAAVQVLEADNDAGDKEFGLFFTEPSSVAKVIAQIAPVAVVHD
jgi:hypothetical protein